ncbi:MAG: DUF4340 domain-containing protein [Acetobacteraceae bacterium]|nr:DUF4340 domain-containing protein [Acetobacteraceae bacterium]
MNLRNLAILVALGVIVLAGGWYFGAATTPDQQAAVDAGKLMFPDLAPKLQQAAKIEITHQGKPMAIDHKPDGTWGLEDRDGYRVQETKLRGMLTGLTELRLVEPRTTDPAEFTRLGVEDPNAKTSNSNLLQVLDTAGKPIVAVIVGHRRVRTQGNVPEQVYVRRPGDNQAWLAEGTVQVDADPQLWFDRDIMNIDHSRIARVEATHGDATVVLAQQDGKLAMTAPAEHPKLDDYRVEDVGRALELLTFQDVQTDQKPAGDESGHAVFTTTDGLAITARVFHSGADVWARFAVAGTDASKAEADRLRARLGGWTYQLGSWKEKALVPALDDLKAEEKSAPAASGGAIPQAAAPSMVPPQVAVPSAAAPSAAAPLAAPSATPRQAAPRQAAPAPTAPVRASKP